MGFIFVSYSRKDSNTVDTITSRLKTDGFDIWVDRESIKGGTLWRVEIVEAIDKADAFALMLSPNSAASDNVRKEVDLAESSNRKLFPILLSAVKLPPQLRYQLAGIQWIDYASNPEAKYTELVEVLRCHQQRIADSKVPEIREAELVIHGINLKKFGAKEQEKLLHFLAEITATPRTNLSLNRFTAGSVRAVVNMPAHAAYVLKTAALNRDKRLVEYGIVAIRLVGEQNYALVQAGKFGPLKIKPHSPFFKNFLLTIIGSGILFGLLKIIPGPPENPSPTPSTNTPTRALTLTPSHTPPPTITKTTTPTRRFTRTPTPNLPPAAPKIISPIHESTVFCDTPPVFLDWTEAYDVSGTDGYEVILDADIDGKWINILTRQVSAITTELDITNEVNKNCGHWLGWRVRAKDQAGLWGDWSETPVFRAENIPPAAPAIVSPRPETAFPCDGNRVFLDWNESYDAGGIDSYEIILDVHVNNQWVNVFTRQTDMKTTEFEITKEIFDNCGRWLSWKVRAKDRAGTWSDWSTQPVFRTVNTPPPAPAIEVSPMTEYARIACHTDPAYYQFAELLWNEPYDTSGIESYHVQLQVSINNQWETILDQQVPSNQRSLEVTPQINGNCGNYPGNMFQVRIQAEDHHGDWGNWSDWKVFQSGPIIL